MERLGSLHTLCSKQDPTDYDIRQISAHLRFLLVEGNLQKVWRLLGFERQPRVNPLVSFGEPNNDPTLTFSSDGYATIGGTSVGGIRMYNRAKSDEEIRSDYKKAAESVYAKSKPMVMTAYLDSNVIHIKGKRMTRRQAIRYLANKLGGVHYDSKGRNSDLDYLTHISHPQAQ